MSEANAKVRLAYEMDLRPFRKIGNNYNPFNRAVDEATQAVADIFARHGLPIISCRCVADHDYARYRHEAEAQIEQESADEAATGT